MGARGSGSATVAPGAKRRRNLELTLLLFALALCGFGYANVDLVLNGSLSGSFAVQIVGVSLLALVAHLAVRKWAPYADPLMLPIAVALTGLGLVMIHRLDFSNHKAYGWAPMLPNQLMWTVIALVAFVGLIAVVKHHRMLARYTYLLMASSLVMLVAPAFFGADTYGARRWIKIGPLQFQPGEFTKIAIVIFFASYLMANRDALALVGRRVIGISLPRGRNLGPILVVWAVSLVVLVAESDLGTSLIFFGAFIAMLYIATQRTGWLVVGGLMALGGATAAATLVSHVKYRVNNWLDPMLYYKLTPEGKNPVGSSPQLAESLFSFGHGGLLGTGLGQGQSWLIKFADASDWILSTVGEELGTAGVMAVLIMYVLLTQRGMRVAVRLSDPFGKLLAAGLSATLILQVFIVAGGVTGLIPQTGKALPFLAQGGSAMVAAWLNVALLIKLSDAAGRAEMEPKPDPNATLTISAEEIARAHAEMEQTGN